MRETLVTIIVAVIIGIVSLLLDRRDKRKKERETSKDHFASPDRVAAARQRVQDIKNQTDRGL